MIRSLTPVLTVVAVLSLGGPPAAAQSWLDQAGEALETLSGEAGGSDGADGGGPTQGRIADGLREALSVGTRAVVAQLGARDGFLGDETVRIPLPDSLKTADELLATAGHGQLGDEVRTRMNRGAEAAMDEARPILIDAISRVTLDDARAILKGPEDAATRYLRRTAGPAIEDRLRPIIKDSLAQVGALGALDAMLGRYKELPFVPDVSADLTDHATGGAMDGLFHYIAEEEAAIRADPAARTSDLLREVFGG